MFKAILFDLDNTLYSETCGVFDLIDIRMNEWLTTRLHIPANEVDQFRTHYFLKYGTTLRGLMLHHGVDPREFLDFVHDVPVGDFLTVDEELRRTLEVIPSRKIIFTNSDYKHANRILDALGVRDLFEKVFDIEAMRFVPKPNPEPYQLALEYLSLSPAECLLIDDMERNLIPARQIGMHTVLIGDGTAMEDASHAISNIKLLNVFLHQIATQR